MTELERKALLPNGLRDVLPPDAGFEADLIARLLAHFAARGYARVEPPLIEFEDGLLSGAGVAMSADTFRLMDPVSQRMMGVRADITPQIARIARTRLGTAARPLRLSYAGAVLRVRGTQLRPERQLTQVGAELIGSAAPAADAEIIVLAAESLGALGIEGLSVDLTVPRLVPAVCAAAGLTDDALAALRTALDRKDAVGVATHGGGAADVLSALLAATGPAEAAIERLAALKLPADAAGERERLGQVMALIRGAAPDLKLTLDPVENRGFEYHTGIGFTVFAAGTLDELGAGGRYRVTNGTGNDSERERATGFTLYVGPILAIASPATPDRMVLLPAGTPAADGRRLRADGWVTVAGLEVVDDARAEARRMGCSHVYADGEATPVDQTVSS
jgi:ATP phosphoribosyltransferase regulatory subunit